MKQVQVLTLALMFSIIVNAQKKKPNIFDVVNDAPETTTKVFQKVDTIKSIGKTVIGIFKSKSSFVSITINKADVDGIAFQNLYKNLEEKAGKDKVAYQFADNTITIACEMKDKKKSRFWMDILVEAKAPFKTMSSSADAIVLELKQAASDTSIAKQ